MNDQYLSKQDRDFEQRVRTTLDSGVASLDADTRSRLAASRIQAFERKSWTTRWLPSGNWIPATAFAACAVLAVTLFIANREPHTPTQIAQNDSDFALELLLGSTGEDEEDEENGQEAAGPDFFIQMEAMMLHEEETQNAG
jgi:anti-sigma-K factor RskA